MSKFTIVLLVVALVAMAIAKPQVDFVDADRQVDVVDSDRQVNVVDGVSQVNVVDPIDIIQPRAPEGQ